MRLTADQIAAIKQTSAEIFGDTAQVWLFGSRVDDRKRGGDIDLLIRPSARDARQALIDKIRFLARLEQRLGERKIDVVIEAPDDQRPIVQVAHQTGVRI